MADPYESDLLGNPPPPTFNERMGSINVRPAGTGNDQNATQPEAYTSDLLKPEEPKKASPDWADIPGEAVRNFVPDATEVASGMYQAVRHPIDTLGNVANIGLGYMEKGGKHLGLPSGQGYEQYADAMNNMIYDHYGTMDNFKNTLAHHPVQAAMDISTVLTGGGAALAKVPYVGAGLSLAGKITDPMTIPVGAAKIAAKTVLPEVAGFGSGVGAEAVKQAAESGFDHAGFGQAGKDFRANMRGDVPMETPVHEFRGAIEQIRKDQGQAYTAGMTSVKQSQQIMPFNKIDDAIRDMRDVKNFHGRDIDPATAEIRGKLDNIISDWKNLPANPFHTPAGFDALKQEIESVRKGTERGSPASKVASEYFQAVKGTLTDHVPEYAGVMDAYREVSAELEQIEKTLSLPRNERKGSIDTSLRKIQSIMRNNVNTSYGYRNKLVEYLEGAAGKNLRAAIAGQSMNSLTPRGLQRVGAVLGAEGLGKLMHVWGAPAAQIAATIPLLLTTSSPRLVGEVAHAAGRVARPIAPFANKPMARVYNQAGRADQLPIFNQARGGRIARALRATKRGQA